MKVENYAAAVEFYSKAISLDTQNAVYYCNRSARRHLARERPGETLCGVSRPQSILSMASQMKAGAHLRPTGLSGELWGLCGESILS